MDSDPLGCFLRVSSLVVNLLNAREFEIEKLNIQGCITGLYYTQELHDTCVRKTASDRSNYCAVVVTVFKKHLSDGQPSCRRLQ